MTIVFPSPKESTTPLVNSFDDSFGDVEGRHIMKGERTENRGAKSETASAVKKGGAPTRQVSISGRD
jgi:hypothetical protein